MPSSSTSAEMFSAPDCSKMALASGGIFGCPRFIANVTDAIITIDIPRAVKGVEPKTK
jgi:hypothetical protein